MGKKGRKRLESSRRDRGLFASLKRTVMGCFLRVSREGPEGDKEELEAPASCQLLQKGIAIGAALGGAGLIPGTVVYAAGVLEGTQMAVERTLENAESSVVSLDVENKAELKAEEAPLHTEGRVETEESVLFLEPEVSPEMLSASASTSMSQSTSYSASLYASQSVAASESASLSMSDSESMSVSASESLSFSASASVSVSTSASMSISTSTSASEVAKAVAEEAERELSAAEEEEYEEDYYDYDYEEEEDWESPTQILESLWEGFVDTESEGSVEAYSLADVDAERAQAEASLSTSASASMSASERSSMFTSIAVAASELQVQGMSNAAKLESQYGLHDFTALANAVANENDAVRRNLSASFTYHDGGSENMASILESRSEADDAFSSEAKAVSESTSARESEAARTYFLLVQAMGEYSPAEII